jgi:hypothetical protein
MDEIRPLYPQVDIYNQSYKTQILNNEKATLERKPKDS